MAQDTGKFRTNTKDQYYTNEEVARKCVLKIKQLLPQSLTYQWIEPSAGNGAFLKTLNPPVDKIGIDIDPKAPGILQNDFLQWQPTTQKPRVFFGNPPFGRQGSLAKAFIKHAAKHADVIAFILPRSFVKPSMSRVFPLRFHCIHQEELESNAFVVNEEAYDVPCVFQIWEKREINREATEAMKEEGFIYVKGNEDYHIAFRRVGGTAGKCYRKGTGDFSIQSHYFIKVNDEFVQHLDDILEKINAHEFPSNTVGPRSLSKSEANEVINAILLES